VKRKEPREEHSLLLRVYAVVHEEMRLVVRNWSLQGQATKRGCLKEGEMDGEKLWNICGEVFQFDVEIELA
jgi:hypothetical protein